MVLACHWREQHTSPNYKRQALFEVRIAEFTKPERMHQSAGSKLLSPLSNVQPLPRVEREIRQKWRAYNPFAH